MNLADILKSTGHRSYPPPSTPWLMTQSWDELLFAHWRVPKEQIALLIPKEFEVDTYDQSAWIGVVPFMMRKVRFARTPFLPYISEFLELNVRTYVRYKGEPGVYFFSLDASNPLAVDGARISYSLPYFNARMRKRMVDGWSLYESKREDKRGADCQLKVLYRPLATTLSAVENPDGLPYFLTERYRLFTKKHDQVYKAEVHHAPWPLQLAEAQFRVNTMLEPLGLNPKEEPILYYSHQLLTLEWAPYMC
ncbi:MAG: DUF2071 domain-containing protein [Cyanobacteria bacterium TGS_CYA1]|nr:DUF2071 domain-containing protein [Cyanobacteria bacterium TGS_CYA1]